MAPKLFVFGILIVFTIQGVICDCPSGSLPGPPPPPGPAPEPSPAPSPGSTPGPSPGPAPIPTPQPSPGTAPEPTPGPSTGSTPAPVVDPKSYPNPKRDENVEDTYGCTKIKDPYRWMENTDSPEVQKFVEDEMAITMPYLEKCPNRHDLEIRYKEFYNFETFSGSFCKGKKFFSFRKTGSQNQDVLYVQDSIKDKGKIFLDINALSKDGTVSMDKGSFTFSDDGLIMAYATSVGGSDWQSVQFKHVEKGDIYKDKLTKIKFSYLPWTKDNKGIFYAAYLDQKGKDDGTDNTKNKNSKIYYHLLGNDQSKDVMVAEFPKIPDALLTVYVSDCGKYFIVLILDGGGNNMVSIAEIGEVGCEINKKLQMKPIISKMEAKYYYIGNNENIFYFMTNKDANNSKIVSIDITNPCTVKDLVPEQKDNLEWAYAAHDKYMVLCYTHEVKSVVQVHDITSGQMVKKFDLEIGKVEAESFFSDRKTSHVFFNLECFLTPGITYHCDLSNSSFDLEVIHEIKLENFCREEYVVKQEYCQSKDGTKIPMYCVHKKISPFILRVGKNEGLGNDLPTDKLIAKYVDWMSFIVINTGIKSQPCGQNRKNPGGP